MGVCSVIGCKERSICKSNRVSFLSFPHEPPLRDLWIKATGRLNWEPTKYSTICSIHFEDQLVDFNKHSSKLTIGSIPTINIATSGACELKKKMKIKRKQNSPTLKNKYYNPSNLCSTCLSSNRKLQPVEIFGSSGIIKKLQLFTRGDVICWECSAFVKKVIRFASQAEKAKDVLTHIHNNKIRTLSTLTLTTKNTYDKTYDEDIPKTEPQDDSETNEHIYSNDYIEETTEFTDLPIDLKVEPLEIFENKIDEVNNIKMENVKIDYNNKKNVNTNDKFNVKTMSDKEMLNSRALDREVEYYKNSVYKCEDCILGYRDKNTYEKHLIVKHSEKAGKYICDICKIRVSCKKLVRAHISGHYKHYTCKVCGHSHHSYKTMVHHYRSLHDTRLYMCSECGNEYQTWRALRYHRDNKHKERPKCEHCGRSFPNTTNLKRHLRVHISTPKVECPVCHKKYNEWALKAHMKFHDPNMATEDAYCAECDLQFRNTMLYKSHLKKSSRHITNDVKKHICQECGKRFTDRIFLQRHFDGVHLKKREHVCHICSKMYNKPDSLRRHIRQTHEGIGRLKDKVCHVCDKRFTCKTQLREHLNSHTGERPYSCSQCSASFGFASALYMHNKLIHLKIKKSLAP